MQQKVHNHAYATTPTHPNTVCIRKEWKPPSSFLVHCVQCTVHSVQCDVCENKKKMNDK